jgi:hypothetical protein
LRHFDATIFFHVDLAMTDKLNLGLYLVEPSTLVQSYASASTSSSSSSVPSVPDLLTLESELKSIQGDLEDRRAKLKGDEEKLRNWKAKGKGKEKDRPSSVAPQPPVPATNGTNGISVSVPDNKPLQRMIRDSSGAFS